MTPRAMYSSFAAVEAAAISHRPVHCLARVLAGIFGVAGISGKLHHNMDNRDCKLSDTDDFSRMPLIEFCSFCAIRVHIVDADRRGAI